MKLGDKVILFGFIDGCSYETAGQTNYIIALETGERVEIPFGGAINVDEIVFKDNIKLKDVIKRIKGFDDGTKYKWTYDILKELGSDFCSKMFHEAYQQGKLEGEWVGNQLKDADKIRQELNKPVIPQFVADWIEVCKEHLTSSLYLAMTPSFLKSNNQGIELTLWIKKNEETFARAWLDGYEFEKEKRYLVKVKGNIKENMLVYGEFVERYFFTKSSSLYNVIHFHTRKELEDAGFGWVFDCPGIEIEEVEK